MGAGEAASLDVNTVPSLITLPIWYKYPDMYTTVTMYTRYGTVSLFYREVELKYPLSGSHGSQGDSSKSFTRFWGSG